MVGHYLTSAGTAPVGVLDLIRRQGLDVKPTPDAARWAFRGEAPPGEAAWNRRAAEGEPPSLVEARALLPVVP
jgi:hypothetical protein